jgi:hexokinase
MLLHFIDSSLLFDGHSSPLLNTHYGYDTAFVSKVAAAKTDDEVKKIILSDLQVDVEHISPGCIELVRWAIRMVSERAAALAACAIGSVVIHTGNDKPPAEGKDTGVDVGLDGSVAEFLPGFEDGVRKTLRVLLGEEGAKRVRMGLAKDGSGVGGMSCVDRSEADLSSRIDSVASKESTGQASRLKNRGGIRRGHSADWKINQMPIHAFRDTRMQF